MKSVSFCIVSFFILLIAFPVFAQTRIRVVTPNGDSATYVRERSRIVHRVIVQHDTVIRIERDTISHVYDRETVTRPEISPVDLSFVIQPAIPTETGHKNTIGLFGYADFRGACVAPAASIDLLNIQFWIYVGGYYVTDGRHITTWTAGISAFTPLLKF